MNLKLNRRAVSLALALSLCLSLGTVGVCAEEAPAAESIVASQSIGVAVTGSSYYGTDYVQFTIAGAGNSDTFYDVKCGDTYIARRAVADAGENTIGFTTDTPLAYTLSVYTKTREPLAAGRVVGVYANGALTALATVGSGETRTFTANSTYTDAEGTVYDLNGEANQTVTDRTERLDYTYTRYTAPGQTGTISYVDRTGAVLDRESFTLAEGETRTVPLSKIPEGYTVAGGLTQVNARFGGQVDFTILCTALSSYTDGAYQATILLVDESGKLLMTDTVNVTRDLTYTYSLPTRFAVNGGETTTVYTRREDQPAAFELKPGDAEHTRTAIYTTADTAAQAVWTIVAMNGLTGETLSTEDITVAPGETKEYTPAARAVNGQNYLPTGAEQYTYTYGDANPVTYIYYVPDDYVAEAEYTVTLQYLNIANNAVLFSKSISVAPGADTTIATESTHTANGVQYVRLGGQSDNYTHSYYSPKRTYTIYYRDVNNTLYANTTITTTQTITTERTQETVVTHSDGTTVVGGAVTAGPTAGQTLTATANEDTGENNLLTDNGTPTQDALDEIIDNETPLAGPDAAADAASDLTTPAEAPSAFGWVQLAMIGAGALILLLLLLIVLQHRKSKEEQ